MKTMKPEYIEDTKDRNVGIFHFSVYIFSVVGVLERPYFYLFNLSSMYY